MRQVTLNSTIHALRMDAACRPITHWWGAEAAELIENLIRERDELKRLTSETQADN